jgi:NADPH:quinone reductase-like Zn-dependent oxidoreductase
VETLGAGVTLWQPGARVMGIVGGGAHAEYVCVHEREALPVPDGMSWEEAAAVPEVFLTAYDALFRQLEVRLGERLLVHAVGSGVGTAAVQLALVAGATVIGTSRSAAKLVRARELGLDFGIDTSVGDWAAQLEERAGANAIHAIMDLVGGDYLRGNLRVLAPRGRLAVIGLTAGSRSEMDLAVLLHKRLRVVGTMLRFRPLEEKIAVARDFAERVVPLLGSGRVRPVIDRVLSFREITLAHELLESDATFGKIVLRWD